MSVLSNTQILRGRNRGDIVIEPFVEANVRKNSVDLTLGEWFYRGTHEEHGIYSPFDEAEVARNFVGPFQAKPYFNVWRKLMEQNIWGPAQLWPRPQGVPERMLLEEEIAAMEPPDGREGDDLPGIPFDHPVIVLMPREFILAHTHEFCGANRGSVPEMRARSSWGRNRISVCLCAGWGDTGYVNRWTMEVHNLSNRATVLPIGERLSQLVFHETGDTAGGRYGAEETYESKYQQSDDIAEVIANWSPTQMLPRNYKDKRKAPLPLEVPATAT
jgi:deoxycytidine triphosphate deaminase